MRSPLLTTCELTTTYKESGEKAGVKAEMFAVVTPGGIVASIAGGDFPHVGAVALAEPRPSRKYKSKTSSTVSVLVRLGHKEDELVRKMAGRMASELKVPIVLSAGIHIENATASQIRAAEELGTSLAEGSIPTLRKQLRGRPSKRTRSP